MTALEYLTPERRRQLAEILTTHAAELPATPAGDTTRRELLRHCEALAGYTREDAATICRNLYRLLADIGTAHRETHHCGRGGCAFLRSINSARAVMARSGALFSH